MNAIVSNNLAENEATDLLRQARALKGAGYRAGAMQLRIKVDRLYQRSNADIRRRADNLNYIAFLGLSTGQFDVAERAARESVAIYRPVASLSDERLATFLSMLSCVLAEREKFLEALVLGEEAAVIFRENHGAQSSFVQSFELNLQRMSNSEAGQYIDR